MNKIQILVNHRVVSLMCEYSDENLKIDNELPRKLMNRLSMRTHSMTTDNNGARILGIYSRVTKTKMSTHQKCANVLLGQLPHETSYGKEKFYSLIKLHRKSNGRISFYIRTIASL